MSFAIHHCKASLGFLHQDGNFFVLQIVSKSLGVGTEIQGQKCQAVDSQEIPSGRSWLGSLFLVGSIDGIAEFVLVLLLALRFLQA